MATRSATAASCTQVAGARNTAELGERRIAETLGWMAGGIYADLGM